MSTTDFIPNRDAERTVWLANYRDKLPNYGKTLGWSDAQVKAAQKRCDVVIDAIAASEQKYKEYLAQVATMNAAKETELTALRADARLIKALPGYTEALGRDLGIVRLTGSTAIAPTTKAEATAEVRKGLVRIKWKKGDADGVNVYLRMRGESEWRLLGRDQSSPYDDRTPLEKAGVVEQREYQVIAVLKDEEVGQPSDILTVTFAG